MTERNDRRPNPLVFLSSTFRDLTDIRSAIFEHGSRYGPNAVWVDEKHRQLMPGRENALGTHEQYAEIDINPFHDIDDYLTELRRSKVLVILIGTERVGSSIRPLGGGRALATFFEMEIAFAAALGRPIVLVLVEGVRPVAELQYLLDILARSVRIRTIRARTPENACAKINEVVDSVARGDLDSRQTSPTDVGRHGKLTP